MLKPQEKEISPLPLYFKIRLDIQERIFSGEWPPGTQIPGEVELAKELGVSVITIRQALSQLVREGHVRRERAKGSFVSPDVPLRQSVNFDVEVDELITVRPEVRFKLISMETIQTPKELKNKFKPQSDGRVSRIVRVRMLNETPLEYVISYIPLRIGSLIPENELSRLPIPNAVESFSSINITEVKHTVRAVLVDAEASLHLEVPAGSPVLLNERDYLSKGEIVTVSVGYFRSDLFRYELRLKRRAGR